MSKITDKPCPRCQQSLYRLGEGTETLLGCASCGATWHTTSDAADVIAGKQSTSVLLAKVVFVKTKPNLPALTREPNCPECSTTLSRVHIHQCDVFVCAEHGTLFDRGVVEEIRRDVPSPEVIEEEEVAILPASLRYPYFALFGRLCGVFALLSLLIGVFEVLTVVGVFADVRRDEFGHTIPFSISFTSLVLVLIATGIAVSTWTGLSQGVRLLLDVANTTPVNREGKNLA